MPSRRYLYLSLVLLVGVVALAAKEYSAPRVYSAKTYPAHDEHPNENVTIAADPYDTDDKADIFVNNFRDHELLPIYLVITNDGNQPISLRDLKLEFITVRKDKIPAATEADLYRRLSHLSRRGDEPQRVPVPVPLPRKSKAGVDKKGREELDKAMFQAKAVEPHESQAGFFFFDISGLNQPLAGAHLYVTGVKDNNGQELMYFEIPMEKYLSYQPPGTEKKP